MPHITIKIVGKTEEEKAKFAEDIKIAVMNSIQAEEKNVSVAIIDIAKEDWAEKVYNPEIAAHWDELYIKPGYDPLA